MRWGSEERRFTRPIRWIVSLLDDVLIPLSIGDTDPVIKSGRISRGHRLLSSSVEIDSSASYFSQLKKSGVEVHRNLRSSLIKRLIDEASNQINSVPDLSDDLLNDIIENRLSYSDCNNGFVLDGYPRTISQKDFLLDFLNRNELSVNFIFDLSINEFEIVKRIKNRSNIEERKDDDEEVIKIRISKYIEETRPLLEFYKTNFPQMYRTINGNQEIEKIYQDIVKIVKK